MDERSAPVAEPIDDPHPFRSDLRAMLSGANLVVLIAAIVAGVWGVFDTLADAGGDRPWGTLSIAAPAVYAGWCMLEMAWKPLSQVATVLLRLMTACFVAPVFVAVPVGIVQAIAVASPGVRQTIDDATSANDGFHYWWSEGIGAQLALVPGAGYVVGMCAPLAVMLIIVMPVLSLRAPRIAAEGSHLEKVEPGRRDAATAFVFVGLGATTLGIGLWAFGDGGSIIEFPEGLARFLNAVSYGYVPWDEAMWLAGVVLVVLGVAAMAWGCVRMLIARGRAAAEAPRH
ncbi:hypothetical protein [Microbacterium esteraromaticum]|uniref:hypothetical protein n=1 Tax=Microbacterium esteraromaticum TaxID=57043 RepID=UPI001957C691|nr:hypothetical protein [Microbacterium esteraromaticum]MBM7465377.1 hypothetical protein [Microbacterium esteraromaticum]